MSKTSNLFVARNVPNVADNKVDNNGFQRPNPKGMMSRMSQEKIGVL